MQSARLASEVEFPEQALDTALREGSDVKETILQWLDTRATLPPSIIAQVASWLEDKDRLVREAAESILRKHRKSYCTLLSSPYSTSLYRFLLQRSFVEQLSWYIDDGHSCINIPEDITRISIQNQQNDVRVKINEARPADMPLICGSG